MTPQQRRGILITLLVLGLTLGVGLGIVLAAGMSASPVKGPRDNGSGVQTPINVSGDLTDMTGQTYGPAEAYWDASNETNPGGAYAITILGGPPPTVAPGGTFNFDVELPLFDNEGNPVRPGPHRITICAPRTPATFRVVDCQSDDFTVLKGTATLSKTSGRQGSPLTISGARWVPVNAAEAIRITWDPVGANQDMIGDQFGQSTWSYPVNVPSLPAGTYQVRICNVSNSPPANCVSDDTIFKQFTVLDPILTLSKSSGETGSPFEFSGDIFRPIQPIKIWFGPKGKPITDPAVHEIGPGGAATDSDGHFGKFTYTPTEGPGDYTVTACTPSRTFCNPLDIATKPYTIVAATPSPTLKPTASPTLSPSPSPSAAPSESQSLSPGPSLSASPAATVGPASAPSTASPTPTPAKTPDETPEATVAPSPPSPSATSTGNITWPDHLHSPGQVSGGGIDLSSLSVMSLVALLIAFLVPFPGTLFNKTVEENYVEIMGWVGGLKRRWSSLLDKVAIGPFGGFRRWFGRQLAGRFGVLIFLGLSALVYGFLSPTFGLDANSLALFLGLLVGLALIVAAFDLPLRLYHGRSTRAHDRGVLRALWWTLLVAVLCVIASRLADFQPGYLYGLIISIVFVTEISTRDEGLGNWLASVWLLVLSFLAWIALALVRQGTFDPWLGLFLQTVLVTFVVAGIETLVIGLLPMRFLPGHPLYKWRKSMWLPIFALSVMGYLLILVDPANGYLSDDSRTPMLVGVIFLVAFGIVSLGTWAYFRYRPARPGPDSPGNQTA